MRIELTCAVCGNNRFALDGDIANEAYVKCADCGHNIGTMGELKQRIADEVMKRAVIRDTERPPGSPAPHC